eukprot:2688909-Pleurochrysis_carterae.AAC.1
MRAAAAEVAALPVYTDLRTSACGTAAHDRRPPPSHCARSGMWQRCALSTPMPFSPARFCVLQSDAQSPSLPSPVHAFACGSATHCRRPCPLLLHAFACISAEHSRRP